MTSQRVERTWIRTVTGGSGANGLTHENNKNSIKKGVKGGLCVPFCVLTKSKHA